MEQKLVYRDPFELRPHPLRRHIPPPDKKAAEWPAFVESVRGSGILHPLITTKDGLLMDGGRLWEAAKELQLPEVPCLIRDSAEAGVIIAETLIHRKLMTRGAAVYLIMPLIKDFVDSSETRRLNNLKNGVKTLQIPLKLSNASTLGIETNQELCQSLGIERETLRRARMVYEIFAKKPELKKIWEPRLLSGEKNLWNVLSGIAGADADQGNRDKGVIDAQLELFGEAFGEVKKASMGWNKFSAAQRDQVITKWRDTAMALPQEMREAMVDALLELENSR